MWLKPSVVVKPSVVDDVAEAFSCAAQHMADEQLLGPACPGQSTQAV
jgi:hypothetical protein